MLMLSPKNWQDYALIDMGNGQKLERFGPYTLIRPEPQAMAKPHLATSAWREMAHAQFIAQSTTKGHWKQLQPMPNKWNINYPTKTLNLTFELGLTAFKHVGLFPEQAANWDFIYRCVSNMKAEQPRVLNLFAYTGGASLAAKSAGADVVHVDSIKQVVTWSRKNMELSNLNNIRWVVEDALKFVQREVKRGRKYNGIILDPPAYGHGPKGEKWKLEDKIEPMMRHVVQLLDKEHFLILNTYSPSFTANNARELMHSIHQPKQLEIGHLCLQSEQQQQLPMSLLMRCRTTAG